MLCVEALLMALWWHKGSKKRKKKGARVFLRGGIRLFFLFEKWVKLS